MKGKSHTNQAHCSYEGLVKGTIDIRELPSLKRISLFEVEGNGDLKDYSYINQQCRNANMMTSVTDNAFTNTFVVGASDYINLVIYVGAKGYIIGTKKHEGKVYLETNLGRYLGAKDGAKVIIYVKIGGDLIRVTEAAFLGGNNLFEDRGFLYIDQDNLSRVMKGMVVKLSGDCSGLKCIGAWFKNLQTDSQ